MLILNMNKKGIERFKMEERRFKIETHLRHDYPPANKNRSGG